MTHRSRIVVALACATLLSSGCAYFNTLYNARLKYGEAQEQKRRADPEREKISKSEERLYTEAFDKAARVVKYHPNSKWVDDALLLMGKSSFEKGDLSTAQRKFDEILTFYPDSNLLGEALLMKGRSLVEAKEYGEAVTALERAAETGKEDLQGDVKYFLGVVERAQGNDEEALAAFADVITNHRGSEWFAEAGVAAGEIAGERKDLEAAVSFYEKVRKHGRTPEDKYLGGVRKGEALLELGEYERAKKTFDDVADRTMDEEKRGEARLLKGEALLAQDDEKGAVAQFREILEKFPRKKAAARAQYKIAKMYDDAGDLERAMQEYELVKDQGTGHPAWQEASARRAEIQRVLDLRQAIADDEDPDRERNRFLLAEQLLESIGDVDAALSEYASLAEDARGTQWGARALFAQAWVLENRRKDQAAADSLLFQLANYYSGTEVDAFARRRLGYPVWHVEIVEPPPVQFIRPDAEEEADVVLERVEPENVALPPGTDEVKVWVRVQVSPGGTAESAQLAKSAGEGLSAFDDAALAAARQSRFLAPDAGGPEFNVLEYTFPPPAAPVEDDEPTAEARDALLNGQDAALGRLPVTPQLPDSTAAADTTAAKNPKKGPDLGIRDRRLRDSRDD